MKKLFIAAASVAALVFIIKGFKKSNKLLTVSNPDWLKKTVVVSVAGKNYLAEQNKSYNVKVGNYLLVVAGYPDGDTIVGLQKDNKVIEAVEVNFIDKEIKG